MRITNGTTKTLQLHLFNQVHGSYGSIKCPHNTEPIHPEEWTQAHIHPAQNYRKCSELFEHVICNMSNLSAGHQI